jgi:hypothetical protein
MGRKNKRILATSDSNFDKFMKSINNKKPSYDSSSKQSPHVHSKVPQPKKTFEKPKLREMTYEEKVASRLKFAEEKLTKNDIQYKVMNSEKGDIYCYRKSDMAIFQYNAFTGVITGYQDFRGIASLVQLLLQDV